MKKLAKILAVLALVLALLAVGLVIAVKMLISPEKVRALVAAQVEKNLHRQVRLGAVDIGLWSGISIADFALSENPDFKKGTFVESGSFVLKFQLLPLLRKQVIVDEVALERPRIRIVRQADGKTFNFSDLTQKSSAPAAAAPAQRPAASDESAVAPLVSSARISDGALEYQDLSPARDRVTLSGIDLNVHGTGFDKPLAVRFSLDAAGELNKQKLQAALSGEATVELGPQKINIQSLSVKTPAASVDAKGRVASFSDPDVDLEAAVKVASWKELSRWVSLPPELKISGEPALQAKLRGTADKMNAEMLLDLTASEVAYSQSFAKPAGTAFSLAVKALALKSKEVQVPQMQMKLASMELSARGRALLGTDTAFDLQLAAAPFELKDLAALSPLAKPYSPSGKLGFKASVGGSAKQPKVAGALQLENVSAVSAPYQLEALNGSAQFDADTVRVPQLAGRISAPNKPAAPFKIVASLQDFKKPRIKLDAEFTTLDLGLFMDDSKKQPASESGSPGGAPAGKAAPKKEETPLDAEGQVRIGKLIYTKFEAQNAQVAWKLTGVTSVMDRMNGQLRIATGKGKINDIPLLRQVAPILRIDPSGLAFEKMGGLWNIVQGLARTDDFQINSPTMDADVKGSLHLPTNRPDLALTAKLPAGSLGGTLGDLSNDEKGRPTFVFKIKDTWKPSLDTSQAQKRAGEQLKKKADEFLQNEGKKLLEGIFR